MTLPDLPLDVAWRQEPGSGRGRSHGTSSREPFDRWFRYPAGFASDYVELLLDRLGLTSGTVVDCFAGSGVTGTAARARGLGFQGIEAHPLIAELATLKLAPTVAGTQIRTLAAEVARSALGAAGSDAAPSSGFDLDSEPELVRRSFSVPSLTHLVALREQIKARLGNEPAADYLKWALLGTLRDVAGVKVGWPYQRPGIERKPRYTDPIRRFEARAEVMAQDLDSILDSGPEPDVAFASTRPDEAGASAQVVVGDSRDSASWEQLSSSAAACIASPPYMNNFDYADATRLELFFWGEVVTWGDMCREVRADMLTATTQQSSVPEMKAAISELETRGPGSAPVKEILELVESITDAKRRREKRSKEYNQVAPAYFLAMWDIVQNLHEHLEPGGTALWLVGDSAPYGVYVDTPRLIGELAQECGFVFAEDVSLRVRGNRWGQNADRHSVPLAERLIVLHKRGGG